MRSDKHRLGFFIAALVLFTGLLIAQAPPAQTVVPALPPQGSTPARNPDFNLSVNVQLVNVATTVLDERQNYVDGLKQEDFQVFEDGAEQKVSFFSHDRRIPVSIGVLVDISGSMRHKLQQALQTAREISLALSEKDEMFLLTFNTDIEMRQHLTSDKSLIERSLVGIRTSGNTSVYDALQMGLDEMKSAHNSKKTIILISDGFDSSSKLGLPQVEELLKRAEVGIYAIGIDDDETDTQFVIEPLYHIYQYMLNDITSISGGRVFRMFTGKNYALDGLAKTVMDELHQQYVLGYYPTVGASPTFRKIDVKVDQPRTDVRHRTGYYSATPAAAAR